MIITNPKFKLMKFKNCLFYLLMLFVIIALSLFSCKSFKASERINAIANLNSDILIGPGVCVLKKFQATSVENKFYVAWIYQSNTNEFVFQLEKSIDGKNFKPFFFKKGYVSSGSNCLMISLIDSTANGKTLYYRIKAIGENVEINAKQEKDYKSLYDASTVMVIRNQKTKGYNLLAP